jgi:cytidylate kinase
VIIAIDGPAASGKSTVAKAVARRLGMHYLDTGAMYRAVAWLALERGVPADDAGQLAALAFAHPVTFAYEDASTLPTGVYIADRDVTVAIRQPEVDAAVSAVASVPEVRAAMVSQQRRLAGEDDTVVEGRDIGTVVFPDAELKVFLTASADERARRRRIDLVGAGHDVETNEVRERLERRDYADSTREASPLDIAEDAQRLDTTGLPVEEVVERIAILAGERR